VSDAPGPGQAGPQTQLPEPPRPPLPPTPPERGGRRALILGLVGLVTVPILLVGLVLSFAAVVTGVRSRKHARRILAPAPGAMAGVVLGSIGLSLCAVSIAVNAVVWKDMSGYETCRQSALTIDDKQTCQDRYFPRIEQRLHMPKDSLRPYRSWF
jgi:hypothetical protein